jgi:hypothetical protein
MRRSFCVIAVALSALIAPSLVKADDIIYTVNESENANQVTGTVTTDGTIGTLSSVDIVAWDLSLTSSYASPVNLDTTNSTLVLEGSALSATSDQLFFDFTAGGALNQYLIFHDLAYVSWWDVVSQPPYDGYLGITSLGGLSSEGYSYLEGNEVIADNGVATPEPGTSSLMLLGVGLIAVMMVACKRISA